MMRWLALAAMPVVVAMCDVNSCSERENNRGDGAGEQPSPGPTPSPTACNGYDALCGKAYNDVIFATNHNAFSATDHGFLPIVANHHRTMRAQLDSGIRGLSLDIYEDRGEIVMCHGSCEIFGRVVGRLVATDALRGINDFLDQYPREVLTIHLQMETDPFAAAASFDASGIADRAYVHQGGAWPTLGELIARDERVVIFTSSTDGPDWMHPARDFLNTTGGSFSLVDSTLDEAWERLQGEQACILNKDPSHGLIWMNHYFTLTAGVEAAAERLNPPNVIVDRFRRCAAEWGRSPTVIAVDYAEYGDVVRAAAILNGVAD